jgi:hypothetical protein
MVTQAERRDATQAVHSPNGRRGVCGQPDLYWYVTAVV